MPKLPRDIDPDVVIEIGRRLDDEGHLAPVPINDVIRQIRWKVQTRHSDQAIAELIIEMASKRGLTVIFDKPAAESPGDQK